MAGPYDPTNSRVQVSATLNGTYVNIGYVTGWTGTHGSAAVERTEYLGGEITSLGRLTDSYTIPFVMDLADTNGQNLMRSSRDNGTKIFLRIMPEGTATGNQGYKQEILVTEYSDNGAAADQLVTGSFSAESTGVRVDVTL